MFGTVRKFMVLDRQFVCSQHCFVCYRTQCKNSADRGALLELGAQIGVTGLDLERQRFIVRWQALHSVRDTSCDQFQTVVRSERVAYSNIPA